MTLPVIVVGLGNRYRRDDGVGPAVVDELTKHATPGLLLRSHISETSMLLEAWAGVELAIVVDACVTRDRQPGRIRRFTSDCVFGVNRTTNSHDLDLIGTFELGRQLNRSPSKLVLYTIDVIDVGHGQQLSPRVAAAVPEAAAAIVTEAKNTLAAQRIVGEFGQ